MDTQEIDSTLDELETRLDRLRGLYEQYFLGIEKIEPAVARKDVDRRFWVLRRVKIRNTARRWRLQVLTQRYNTFQQYWTRICREIENGTYVRHLLKAKKNLGAEPKTWAAKKRMGLLRRDQTTGDASGAPAETGGEAAGASEGQDGGPGHAARASAPAARGSVRPVPMANRSPSGPFTLDDLGPLDLDFDEDEPTLPPQRPVKRPSALPPAMPSATSPQRGAVRPALPARAPQAAAPAKTNALPAPGGAPPMRPAAARPPLPAAPAALGAPRPPGPAAGAPAAPRPPPPAAAPAAPRPPVVGAPPAGPAAGLLSEDRVRKIHAELVAAKRQLNQGDSVSMDSLARSLRETEKKLRAQHAGRSVDFQIVVKDGKPVVKPVVRR